MTDMTVFSTAPTYKAAAPKKKKGKPWNGYVQHAQQRRDLKTLSEENIRLRDEINRLRATCARLEQEKADLTLELDVTKILERY